MADFPEPTRHHESRADVLVEYLHFFRLRTIEIVKSLPPVLRRQSTLPSGWSPLQLARHLTFVEYRWLNWGFLGECDADPWADESDGVWTVPEGLSDNEVLDALRARGPFLRRTINRHALDERGAAGQRWNGAEPATLERILLHLIQEYARHLGQLDIVAELAGSAGGE